MPNTLLRICLAGLLALGAAIASAQDTGAPTSISEDEQESCTKIRNDLLAGSSPDQVVRATVTAGKTLAEATVFAMVCGGEDYRAAVAAAGVAAAGNLAQAQFVATAVMAAAGQTGPVADAVRAEVETYARNMPQPQVHEDRYTPYGGGVSPAT